MKGKVTLTIRDSLPHAPDECIADCAFDGLTGSGAALLVWLLCHAMRLSFEQRGAILHLIASGAMDPLESQAGRGVS